MRRLSQDVAIPVTAKAAFSITALVMRFKTISPMVGNIAISLSATYHWTAAVAATGVTMTFGNKDGSARIIAQNTVEPFAPPTPITPERSPVSNFCSKDLVPPAIMVSAAWERSMAASSSHVTPEALASAAPPISAPALSSGRRDRSITQGSAPAFLSTPQVKRAASSLLSEGGENGDFRARHGYPVFSSGTALKPRVALGTDSSMGNRSAEEPPT